MKSNSGKAFLGKEKLPDSRDLVSEVVERSSIWKAHRRTLANTSVPFRQEARLGWFATQLERDEVGLRTSLHSNIPTCVIVSHKKNVLRKTSLTMIETAGNASSTTVTLR